MKWVGLVTIIGLILLYFINAAFKVEFTDVEMLIHSSIRYFTGFIIFGIFCFYDHSLKFKTAVYTVLILMLLDDLYDYFRDVDSLRFEIIFHSIYMLAWGSLTGYLFMRQFNHKTEN